MAILKSENLQQLFFWRRSHSEQEQANIPVASHLQDLHPRGLVRGGSSRVSDMRPSDPMSYNNRLRKRPLVQGPQIFEAYKKVIALAQHEVLMQSFVYQNDLHPAECRDQYGDEPFKMILDGLKELEHNNRRRQGQPVVVRIAINHGPKMWPFCSAARSYNLLKQDIAELGLDPRWVKVEIGRWESMGMGINHAKYLTVDGQVALNTGANIQRCHSGSVSGGKDVDPQAWYDLGFVGAGDVAKRQREHFYGCWRHCRGSQMTAAKPDLESVYNAALEQWFAQGEVVSSSQVQVRLLSTRHIDGKSARQEYLRELRWLIESAQSSIKILTTNLNEKMLVDQLIRAAQKGVKVEIVVPRDINKKRERMPFQGGANPDVARKIAKFIQAHPEAETLRRNIFMGYYRHYRDSDGSLDFQLFGQAEPLSHAKFASFDDKRILIGSSNMDTQSFHHSEEYNWVVHDDELAADWSQKLFDPVRERSESVVWESLRA